MHCAHALGANREPEAVRQLNGGRADRLLASVRIKDRNGDAPANARRSSAIWLPAGRFRSATRECRDRAVFEPSPLQQ
jgi:hypothetical protein